MFPLSRIVVLAMLCFVSLLLSPVAAQDELSPEIGGEMLVFDMANNAAHLGSCPLKHTDVRSVIFGHIVRTTVRQTFENTFDQPIEAKYVFPLPEDSAVDEMTMMVGDRRIVGEIHEKSQARRIYEEAKSSGYTTSLLNQQRPNCFTQRIANIAPGEQIIIEISFLETLQLCDGVYEWSFPMVVGERYVSDPTATDTPQVLDAEEILPPVTTPEVRAGHTISLSVDILGSAPITDVESLLHKVGIVYTDENSVRVSLAHRDEVPNRDFILRYRSAGADIEEGLFLYQDEHGSYFTLLMQPPARVDPKTVMPREVIFVIDSSGSMNGAPLDTARRTMKKCIETLGPDDTFDLLAFASNTQSCFERPVPNTPENLQTAMAFLDALGGHGGTEMMPAVQRALGGEHDPERLRIVCFMTDGYIGYEYQLLSEIRENVDTARVFSFGIGNGVNRFLLDQMAQVGRGDVSYITLNGDAQAEADRFLMRIHAPVLTDIAIDWGGLPVTDVTPRQVPDLFSESPILVHGRIDGGARDADESAIRITGNTAEGTYEQELVATPKTIGDELAFIPKLWARSHIADLQLTDLQACQTYNLPDDIRTQIVETSVKHRVLSEYTAFVAVEKVVKVDPTTNLEVLVPVEKTQGLAKTATQDWAALVAGLLLLIAGIALLIVGRPYAAA